MKNKKAKIFDSVVCTIENKDIREFAKQCIETIPNYFWEVGASSTGKYHPQYALGELGLARHTCALVRILNHILNVESFGKGFTSREKDLMRVAGLMHDSRKSGDDEGYSKNKYTNFDHPLLAANVIRNIDTNLICQEEKEFIANIIETHMGQWNTDRKSDVVLPLPKNKYQTLLHLADYLASRKDIEVLFTEEFTKVNEPIDINEYKLDFGKYNGKTLIEISEIDPGYIRWAKEKMYKEPVRTLLNQL